MNKKFFLVMFCLLIFFLLSCKNEPKTGYDVLDLMQKKYNGFWFENVSFKQEVIYTDNQTKKEIWYEWMLNPSKLLIIKDSINSGNAMIFAYDSVYYYENRKFVKSEFGIHYLIVLTVDIYTQDLENIISKLESEKFNLQKCYSKKYKNREVWVVGADENDTLSNQFLIDKETLLFVKSKYNRKDKKIREIEFSNWTKIENAYIEQQVDFYLNSQLEFTEKYFDIKIPDQTDTIISWLKATSNYKTQLFKYKK